METIFIKVNTMHASPENETFNSDVCIDRWTRVEDWFSTTFISGCSIALLMEPTWEEIKFVSSVNLILMEFLYSWFFHSKNNLRILQKNACCRFSIHDKISRQVVKHVKYDNE